ncbi:hypothetical protein CEXT_245751 [Caerostris extrusa]|uniref:Uncharacterized protein n=1 Tax=Caerostris extrusa TaxID=172846 RepID=A0AAV4XLA2_CAEEX|nr:hypothetical protein CEXT_245751 [Caerostris extrusa]
MESRKGNCFPRFICFYHPVKGVPEVMFKRESFPSVEGSYGETKSNWIIPNLLIQNCLLEIFNLKPRSSQPHGEQKEPRVPEGCSKENHFQLLKDLMENVARGIEWKTQDDLFQEKERTIHKPLLSVTCCASKQANKSEGGSSRMMTRKLFTLLSVPCNVLRSCGPLSRRNIIRLNPDGESKRQLFSKIHLLFIIPSKAFQN